LFKLGSLDALNEILISIVSVFIIVPFQSITIQLQKIEEKNNATLSLQEISFIIICSGRAFFFKILEALKFIFTPPEEKSYA
jgi:hypothetical protein